MESQLRGVSVECRVGHLMLFCSQCDWNRVFTNGLWLITLMNQAQAHIIDKHNGNAHVD